MASRLERSSSGSRKVTAISEGNHSSPWNCAPRVGKAMRSATTGRAIVVGEDDGEVSRNVCRYGPRASGFEATSAYNCSSWALSEGPRRPLPIGPAGSIRRANCSALRRINAVALMCASDSGRGRARGQKRGQPSATNELAAKALRTAMSAARWRRHRAARRLLRGR